MWSIVGALMILSLGFSLVRCELNDTCQASNRQTGRCVLVRDCQYVLNILRSPNPTPEDLHFLDHNHCGKSSSKRPMPLVCCPMIPNVKGCGVAKISQRIYGGNETTTGVYPWAGVIEYRTTRGKVEVQCGCALIHHRWVLTAAHCIVGIPRKLRLHAVRFNEWNTRKKNPCFMMDDTEVCRAVYEVEERFSHPSYSNNNPSMRHDIGLLKTKQDVKIDDYVIPICLPFSDTVQELEIQNEEFVVTGWGQTDKDTPGLQRHVYLKGSNNSVCNDAFRGQRIQLSSDQLCIGGQKGQDSCRGDSGGPLMYEHELTTYIVGIVSFGAYECGTADHPGVYTKVVDYLDWIDSIMVEN